MELASVGLRDICFGNTQHDESMKKLLCSWGPAVPSQVSREPFSPLRGAASSGGSLDGFAVLTMVSAAEPDPVNHTSRCSGIVPPHFGGKRLSPKDDFYAELS